MLTVSEQVISHRSKLFEVSTTKLIMIITITSSNQKYLSLILYEKHVYR